MSAGTPIYDIEGIALDSTGENVAGSLGDRVSDIYSHLTDQAALVYPTMAGGQAVTSAAGAWNLTAAFVEIVPTTTITPAFHIRSVAIEAAAVGVYEVVLYAVEVEIARFRFAVVGAFIGNAVHEVNSAEIASGTQIQVKTASAAGGNAITLSIQYHLHD